MGYLAAVDMIEQAGADLALEFHLQSNCFPPVSLTFLPAVRRAIKKANRGEWFKKVRLPTGKLLTVAKIVEGLQLYPFLVANQDEEPGELMGIEEIDDETEDA